jgi:hypothetical protein
MCYSDPRRRDRPNPSSSKSQPERIGKTLLLCDRLRHHRMAPAPITLMKTGPREGELECQSRAQDSRSVDHGARPALSAANPSQESAGSAADRRPQSIFFLMA